MIDRFLFRLLRGPILLDAAIGTRLIARGLDLATEDPCHWTLTRPEMILDLHRRDIEAGAEVVCTNTFGANRGWLTRWDGGQEVKAINRAAVQIAREAAGLDRFVVGSIGPTAADNPAWMVEQAEVLQEAGVDALVLETFRLDQAVTGLGALAKTAKPIIVSLFDWPDSITVTSRRLVDLGASVVGANCFADLRLARRLLGAITAMNDIPCWLKPSAGVPDEETLTIDSFAALARRVAGLPIPVLLGGCCGTTETHLAAIRVAWELA